MSTLSDYNNNPGNLKPPKGVTYDGQIGVDDKGFAVFENKEYGKKALINDLTHKMERGVNTPEKFVDIFSPAGPENSEESRENYKIYLAHQLGLKSTNDPFPKDSHEKLAHAVSSFEGGTWMQPQKEEKKAAPSSAPEDQYVGEPVATEPSEADMTRAPKEMGAVGAALGAGAGSVYSAKAPLFRMAQRVGLLPGGKPISPAEAADLVERTMGGVPEAAARPMSGGEKWQRSLTGISTPGAQMGKESLDLAKGMQGAVGIGGAPGFTGGTITPGGVILSPQDAAAIKAKQELAAAQIADREARLQQTMQRAVRPDMAKNVVQTIMRSAPVRGAMAGLGTGYNAQDAYQKFTEGDLLGGAAATGAAGASALTLVPKLARAMGPAAIGLTTGSQMIGDIRRGDRQAAAEDALTGLTALAPRLFGPLAAGVYSRGLNEGEAEELARRRMLPPTISP